MKHTLDINRQNASAFVQKAQQFLSLPRGIWECDIKQCNPDLYKGSKGKAARIRARKGLIVLKRVDKDLKVIQKLLERV